MFQNRASFPVIMGAVGLALAAGLCIIALTVGLAHQGLSVSDALVVYKNNPVQWIILTSLIFLPAVFYFMGKIIRAREVKLAQRADYEKQQFGMLEDFIGEMENGNLAATLSEQFENQSLSQKLFRFRDKLAANRDEDQRRMWEKEGLAKFSEIIRSVHDISVLADEAIKFLVRYTESNQGSVFIAEGEGDDAELHLRACYAYDRKKHISQTISAGTGLIGQCYLEKDTIVLTNIPKDYIKITSGLGEATPSFLLIVPMIVEGKVTGIIEIASFRIMESYQVKFIEKAGEAFAAVIQSALTAAEMKHLLEESQQQAEEMKAQEEEMRQSMEELQSIQEQMARQLNDTDQIRKQLEAREQVLDHTTILSETDLYGTITYVNSRFCKVSQYSREELMGHAHNIIRHPDMPKEVFKSMWSTIKKGEIFRGIVKNRKKDGTHYWVDATVVPIFEEGKIVKYIGSRYLIEDEAYAQNLFHEQNLRFGIMPDVVEGKKVIAEK